MWPLIKNRSQKEISLSKLKMAVIFFSFLGLLVISPLQARGADDYCHPDEVEVNGWGWLPTSYQVGSTQANMVVNRSLSCPTDKDLSDYTKDLTMNVPGIGPTINSKPDNEEELEQRINSDKGLIEDLKNVQQYLSNEKSKSDKIADRWVNSEDKSLHTKRRVILERMINNASEKIVVVQKDILDCQKKIANIKLEEALASGDEALKQRAQTEYEQALAEQIAGRVEVQEFIASEKALNDAACWPAGSMTPNIGNCLLIGTGWVGNIIVWLFSLLLWVASKLFDLSIWMSLILIKDWFNTGAVITVWKIIRDLSNLCFVFILLYIALGTIFDLPGMGDTKKLIVGVIIAALFVNFSGFFVRVVVDASNVIAYEFYIQLKGPSGNESISTALVRKMDLGQYFIDSQSIKDASGQASQKFQTPTVNRLSFIGIIGQTFGNVIIILIAAFVLLAASALFLIRTIYLLFLYILSPAAFVSRIIPGLNYFDKWQDALIKQSFFAPAFLIPFYLVFVLLGENGISSLGSSAGGWGGLISGGSLTLVMANAIIIGLLLGCLSIATKFGAVGAKKLSGWQKGLSWGALGMAGAYTVGKGANSLAKTQVMQKFAARSPVLGGTVLNATNRVARAGFGTGTSGYAQRTETRRKAQQEQAKSFTGPTADKDRANYLRNLIREKDRVDFYEKLSKDDRAKVNKELIAMGETDLANKLAISLKGKEGRETAVANYKEVPAKEKDRLEYLRKLDKTQLENLYNGSTNTERAELERLIRNDNKSTPAIMSELQKDFRDIVTDFTTKPKNASELRNLERERRKVAGSSQSEEAIDDIRVKISNPGASITKDEIGQILPEMINDLEINELKDPRVAIYLTTAQLNKIKNERTPGELLQITPVIKAGIARIRASFPAGIANPAQEAELDRLDRLEGWLNLNGA